MWLKSPYTFLLILPGSLPGQQENEFKPPENGQTRTERWLSVGADPGTCPCDIHDKAFGTCVSEHGSNGKIGVDASSGVGSTQEETKVSIVKGSKKNKC